MSKSLARVTAALAAAGIASRPIEMPSQTRTARDAADAAGCDIDQIVKSIIFEGQSSKLYLFLTAGGGLVEINAASALVGEPLGRADAQKVREVTGFAIGGVSPLGHLTPLPVWMDENLLQYQTIWAAAGTPNHIFQIGPQDLVRITGACLARFT